MATYISNINTDRLKDLLIKMKKDDTLIIFHSSEEKQIPIDMISAFSNTKGTVEFKELEDEVEIAFEIGKLYAKAGTGSRSSVEILGNSSIFTKINNLIGIKKKPVSRTRKTKNTTKENTQKTTSESPDTVSKKKTTATDKTESKSISKTTKTVTKKSAVSKSNVKKSAASSDSLFDMAYNNFTGLIDSLKTDKYDPSVCSLGIMSAVRLMNDDPTLTFEKTLPTTTTSSSAKKFLNQIAKEDIKKVIEAAKEVIKYDV